MEQEMLIGLSFVGIFSAIFFIIMVNTFVISSRINKLIQMCKNENNMIDAREDLKELEELKQKFENKYNSSRRY